VGIIRSRNVTSLSRKSRNGVRCVEGAIETKRRSLHLNYSSAPGALTGVLGRFASHMQNSEMRVALPPQRLLSTNGLLAEVLDQHQVRKSCVDLRPHHLASIWRDRHRPVGDEPLVVEDCGRSVLVHVKEN